MRGQMMMRQSKMDLDCNKNKNYYFNVVGNFESDDEAKEKLFED